jgi:hypothetical protein
VIAPGHHVRVVVLVVAAGGCGGAEPCGDGIAKPGEVCLEPGPDVEGNEQGQVLMHVDADGIADLVGFKESLLRLLRNRGDATFEPVGDLEYDSLGGIPIVLPDLDGDGTNELAVLAEDPDPDAVRDMVIFERDAEGTLQIDATITGVWPSRLPHRLAPIVGDFDGDGDGDLAVYDAHRVTLAYRIEGGFADTIALDGFGINANGVAEVLGGDLDGDGAVELVHVTEEGVRVRSGPELALDQTFPLAWKNGRVSLGDVDGDGAHEVIAWLEDGVRISGTVLRLAPASGTSSSVTTFEAPGATLRVADLNGDALDDLVLFGSLVGELGRIDPFAGDPGHVLLAAGDGSFLDPVRVPGLDWRDWRPAHLDDDGLLDFASFSLFESCRLPACSFYGEPLLSSP